MREPMYRLDQTFRIGAAGAVYRQVVRSDDIGPYVAGYEVLTPADLVAVVRRGVESGTIKWAVEWRCELTRVTEAGEVKGVLPGSQTWQECFERRIHQESYSCGWALVIPVSDGGSET